MVAAAAATGTMTWVLVLLVLLVKGVLLLLSARRKTATVKRDGGKSHYAIVQKAQPRPGKRRLLVVGACGTVGRCGTHGWIEDGHMGEWINGWLRRLPTHLPLDGWAGVP